MQINTSLITVVLGRLIYTEYAIHFNGSREYKYASSTQVQMFVMKKLSELCCKTQYLSTEYQRSCKRNYKQ